MMGILVKVLGSLNLNAMFKLEEKVDQI